MYKISTMNINIIPREEGYYKWFCEENDFNVILKNLGVVDKQKIGEIKQNTEIQNNKYCIYVGIANKSLYERIVEMHLHKDIKRSTLRHSISAVFNIDSKNEDAISKKMGDLYVEWYKFKNPSSIEENQIKVFLRILNDSKNHRDKTPINDSLTLRQARRRLRKNKKYW